AQLMLDVVGLDYTLREVPFEVDRVDWHVAVNPLGGIPALVDGDFRLAESNTILRYLADKAGREDLYPRDPQARATVDWVLDVWALVVRPALFPYESAWYGIALGRGMFANDAKPEDEVRALFDKAVPKLSQAMEILDPIGPWACLGHRTIADIAATPVLHRIVHAPVDLDQVPRMRAWADACLAMPEWQALVPSTGVPDR
ncbi:MAG: glutathione S-transferase family protein, partial [Gaiellales bacterium]